MYFLFKGGEAFQKITLVRGGGGGQEKKIGNWGGGVVIQFSNYTPPNSTSPPPPYPITNERSLISRRIADDLAVYHGCPGQG